MVEVFPACVFTAFRKLGVKKWQVARVAGFGDYALSRHLRLGFLSNRQSVRLAYYAAFSLCLENLDKITEFVRKSDVELSKERQDRWAEIYSKVSAVGEADYVKYWVDWAASVLSEEEEKVAPRDEAEN